MHSRQSAVSVEPLLLLYANVSDCPCNITVHLRVFSFWVEDASKSVGIPFKYFESDGSCLYEMNRTLFCMCWLEVRKSSFALLLLSNSVCHACVMHVKPGLSGIIRRFIYVSFRIPLVFVGNSAFSFCAFSVFVLSCAPDPTFSHIFFTWEICVSHVTKGPSQSC